VAGERPTFEVLPGGPEPEGAAAAGPAATPQPAARRHLPGWILAALLALALLALAVQTRRALTLSAEVEGLNGQVARLSGELAETQASLEAHRRHLDQVRTAVDRLQELVRSEPAAPGGSD
jgi:outer membrane murein-binding lipoprotein Lpp